MDLDGNFCQFFHFSFAADQLHGVFGLPQQLPQSCCRKMAVVFFFGTFIPGGCNMSVAGTGHSCLGSLGDPASMLCGCNACNSKAWRVPIHEGAVLETHRLHLPPCCTILCTWGSSGGSFWDVATWLCTCSTCNILIWTLSEVKITWRL